jgi:hypothetical protein
MDWPTIGEIVKVIGAVATAGAAWFAAVMAYRGLSRWQAETIGKHRHDVASTTLALFYQMEEILRSARDPWVLPHEMAKRDGIPDEIAEDANYAPEARLLKENEFFARFRAAKHEFAALFGRDAAVPFDDLWRVRIDINHAVDFMLRNKELGRAPFGSDDYKLWREQYSIAFRDPREGKDEISPRISAQIAAMEKTCRSVIAQPNRQRRAAHKL